MTLRRSLSSALIALCAAVGTSAVPAQAAGFAVPVQCEVGTETVLSWDDVAYDLRGTCGVVRVTADRARVTLPAATRLVVEGADNTVTAKPVYDVEVTGAGNTLTVPSVRSLVLTGPGSSVTVAGLVERAELAGGSAMLGADTINALRMRGTDTVTAREAVRTRVTGSGNTLRLRRADRLVLTGDRNAVVVERGRTTLRDRGEDNLLDLRPRRR
ncbi:DUF3060 domain-containing protein [Nocardioides xinjiangensis]|uniref:DUF3060 domain-containing protein n=1 Tax=Nocardioides xinjiangensis TaxID=2817376 RepID=UPI001B30D6FE|nr:DUF3060 domain-containing protein [Nocardioides sp. SYSU D00514]